MDKSQLEAIRARCESAVNALDKIAKGGSKHYATIMSVIVTAVDLLDALNEEKANFEAAAEIADKLANQRLVDLMELSKWRARAEALERALIDHQGVDRCREYCVHADTIYCTVNRWRCKNADRIFDRKTQSFPPRGGNWHVAQERCETEADN
jgi:hypothetical protein